MSLAQPQKEDFAALLAESFGADSLMEGAVVKGTVIAIEKDLAVIDVGLKIEGRVPSRNSGPGRDQDLKVGDDRRGLSSSASRTRSAKPCCRARRPAAKRAGSSSKRRSKQERARRRRDLQPGQGRLHRRSRRRRRLPAAVSQVDIRPVRDVAPLMHMPQPFQILKMDKRRGNIVVSRRAVLEESRAEQRSEIVQNLEEGQVVDGVVKNITDYGAFVDLGGIDGLLHVTDMAWRRVNHPSEILSIGETVKVQIIRINQETHRISLGMKQLESDPWDGIEAKYPIGAKFTGRVTNITDYGAFVELEPGIEGLIHVSEMSWTKKNVHPGKIVSTSQEVDVMVLEVDPVEAPHLARPQADARTIRGRPSPTSIRSAPIVEGEVKNKTEFGLFIGLDGDVDGMVHLSDLDWNRPGEQAIEDYNKGDMVKAAGSRRRRREGAHLARHQAARQAIRSATAATRRPAQGRRRHLRGHRRQRRRHRSEDRRHATSPPSSAASTCRATATTSVRSVSRSARRSTPASPTSTRRPARSRCRSRRSRSPKRRKPSPSTVRPTPAPRSATSSAQRFAPARTRTTPTRTRTTSNPPSLAFDQGPRRKPRAFCLHRPLALNV